MDREDQLLATLSAALTVIANTHANGYGHFNPWNECDAPECAVLHERLDEASIKLRETLVKRGEPWT